MPPWVSPFPADLGPLSGSPCGPCQEVLVATSAVHGGLWDTVAGQGEAFLSGDLLLPGLEFLLHFVNCTGMMIAKFWTARTLVYS